MLGLPVSSRIEGTHSGGPWRPDEAEAEFEDGAEGRGQIRVGEVQAWPDLGVINYCVTGLAQQQSISLQEAWWNAPDLGKAEDCVGSSRLPTPA